MTLTHFSCDITDIRGILVSKSMEHDIRDIDEFPIIRCREMAEPVTEEHLKKNMRHRELRLDNMLCAEYPWTAAATPMRSASMKVSRRNSGV
ncbi:hypothetical protein QQG75_20490 [Enterobacter hormaechei]|nr:DUF6685 family protein [Enterobacter hormaechei]MDK9637831.1 hypothetical protein [Enterobacter hormaechei]